MTRKKAGGKDFGTDGHRGGRPKGSVLIPRAVKILNRKKCEEIISKYLGMPNDELKKLEKDKKLIALDVIIIKIIIKAQDTGDYTRLNFLFDRTLGKVKEKLDITSDDEKIEQKTVIILPSNNREKK